MFAGGEVGIHKLVSMIRSQHQAWSERLAARTNLTQSTTTRHTEATPPTWSRDPEVGGDEDIHQHPPVLSHDQERMNHSPTVEREETAQPHPHSLLPSHDQDVGVASHLGGVEQPNATEQHSLSIFTLSTR